MSVVSRAVEGVAGAVSAAGEFVAEKLRGKPERPPRMTASVRRAARQAAINVRVGQKQRAERK